MKPGAQSDRPPPKARRPTVVSCLVVISLLALPTLAIYLHKWDWRWVAGYALVVNLLTYIAYASDKRAAAEGAWRVSEMRLHLLELLGGWPAAYLAQQRLRHKSSKVNYRVVFWLIVITYQVAAIDSMRGWELSQAIWKQIEPAVKRRR